MRLYSAGCFSSGTAWAILLFAVFVADCNKSINIIRLICPLKSDFDIAETHDITIFDLSRFTVRYPATVNESAVCRTGISHQKRALFIQHHRGVDLGYAGMVKIQRIVCPSANAQPFAAWLKCQWNFL